MATVKLDELYGCHIWTGRRDRQGYGRTPEGKLAHREAWLEAHGEVPEGLYLDHLCRRRWCCNPEHLEPVTQSTNEKRKSLKHRMFRKVMKCGCSAYEHGIRTPEGGTVCRRCR